MNETDITTAVIREKKKRPFLNVFLIFVILGTVGYGVAVYVQNYRADLWQRWFEVVEPIQSEELVIDTSTTDTSPSVITDLYSRIVAKYSNEPLVFSLVPAADKRVEVKAPPADYSKDEVGYLARSVILDENTKALASQDSVDTLTFDDLQTYVDVVKNHPNAAQIQQLQDEVMFLAHIVNKQYNLPALTDRIKGVQNVTQPMPDPFATTTVLTYPAGRAISIYLATAIMGRIDPVNVEIYNENGQQMAQRGIAYGEYSMSDMKAAQDLVTQYFTLLDFEIESGLDFKW